MTTQACVDWLLRRTKKSVVSIPTPAQPAQSREDETKWPDHIRAVQQYDTMYFHTVKTKGDPQGYCFRWSQQQKTHVQPFFIVHATEAPRARADDLARALADTSLSAKEKKTWKKRAERREWRAYGAYADRQTFCRVLSATAPARQSFYQLIRPHTVIGTYVDLDYECTTHNMDDTLVEWYNKLLKFVRHFHRVVNAMLMANGLPPKKKNKRDWVTCRRHRQKGDRWKLSNHLHDNQILWQDVLTLGLFMVVLLPLDVLFYRDRATLGRNNQKQESRDVWSQRPPLHDTTVYSENRNFLVAGCHKAYETISVIPKTVEPSQFLWTCARKKTHPNQTEGMVAHPDAATIERTLIEMDVVKDDKRLLITLPMLLRYAQTLDESRDEVWSDTVKTVLSCAHTHASVLSTLAHLQTPSYRTFSSSSSASSSSSSTSAGGSYRLSNEKYVPTLKALSRPMHYGSTNDPPVPGDTLMAFARVDWGAWPRADISS